MPEVEQAPTAPVADLTAGGLLARNAIWNLIGSSAPLLVALIAIPIIIKNVGTARYGVLGIATSIVGYMGLFDFGLGRATTKLIADALGAGESGAIRDIFSTSLRLMLVFSVGGALLLAWGARWLTYDVLNVPTELHLETVGAFYLLALSLPFVVSAACFRGTLEAFQRFDLINAVRAPLGIFSFLGLLLVLPFSNSLIWLVAIMVLGRVVGWLAMFLMCQEVLPPLRDESRIRRPTIKPLLSFGGWAAVSGVVSPLMVEFDRFFIGATMSVTALTYYLTPYQAITRLLIIPQAIMSVLFPALSTAFAPNPERAAALFERAVKYLLLILFPLVLTAVTFAPEVLGLWLGPEFRRNSTGTLRWLALGMLTNSLANVPFAMVQAAHRPDFTAKLHVAEAPCYVLVLWLALRKWGVAGAGLAWTARVTVDAIVLFALAARVMPLLDAAVRRVGLAAAAALAVLGLACLPMTIGVKSMFFSSLMALFAYAAWRWFLVSEERKDLKGWLRAAGAPIV